MGQKKKGNGNGKGDVQPLRPARGSAELTLAFPEPPLSLVEDHVSSNPLRSARSTSSSGSPSSPANDEERRYRLSSLRRLSTRDDDEEPPLYGSSGNIKAGPLTPGRQTRTSIDYLEDDGTDSSSDFRVAVATSIAVAVGVGGIAVFTRNKTYVLAATLAVPSVLSFFFFLKFLEIKYLEVALWLLDQPLLRMCVKIVQRSLRLLYRGAAFIVKAAIFIAVAAMATEVHWFLQSDADVAKKVIVGAAACATAIPALMIVLSRTGSSSSNSRRVGGTCSSSTFQTCGPFVSARCFVARMYQCTVWATVRKTVGRSSKWRANFASDCGMLRQNSRVSSTKSIRVLTALFLHHCRETELRSMTDIGPPQKYQEVQVPRCTT